MGRARDPMIDAMAGNYRLVQRIGAGGMGEVYKAINEQIGSKVAIKLLHATALRDKSLQERFILEAKAVNRIDHPGVVKVLDAGRMESGRPFLVMELLDGHSLHELRKANKLSIAQSCRAMADVLDALAAAHAAGVIHRDLKPANLFRTRDGRTVVLDFGIAKLMATDAPVRLTMTGSAVGTPHYMAPEQIRGKEVTPAVDIYAAGVVLFELVCGRRPFDDADEDGVMAGHLERRPPPPRALEPNVPVAVQDIILAALQKDPAKRPPSAAAMRDALRAAIGSSTPVADDGRSPWARPSQPPQRPTPPSPSPSPDSSNVATLPASPIAKIPRTEPQSTPAAVRAHRQRGSRLRTLALVGAATFALAGVVLIVYAFKRSRADTAASRASVTSPSPSPSTSPSPTLVAPDAAVAVEVDTAAGSEVPTCARLVVVDPIGVADARHAEVKATFFRRCEEDRWPVDVIGCFVGASDATDLARCLQTLTTDQRRRLQVALDEPPPRKPVEKKPRAEKPRAEKRDPYSAPTGPDFIKDPFRAPRSSDDTGLLRPDDPPSRATLEIQSTPPGARVTVNGRYVGRTPISTKVVLHTVLEVQLELTGYKPRMYRLDASSERTRDVKAVLEKEKAAPLPF